MVSKERGDERRSVGGEGAVWEFRDEEVDPLKAERPELSRGSRSSREGGEKQIRGDMAGGADGEAGPGRGPEARNERLHLNGSRRGEIGARAEEGNRELRRGRGRLHVAVALALGLIPVFVVVVVIAALVGRRWGPIRRAEGAAVLISAHGGRRLRGRRRRRGFQGFGEVLALPFRRRERGAAGRVEI